MEQRDHGQGHEDVGRELDCFGSGEAGGIDADDGDGIGVDGDDLADGVGRAVEGVGPEAVADDGHGAGGGSAVVGGENGAAEDGLNLDLLIEVSGDEIDLGGLCGAVDGDVGAAEVLEGEDLVEYGVVAAELLVDGV